MKRILPSLFLFLFSFASTTASHKIAGIQLDYASLGNDKYEVFIHVVRQCDGTPLPAKDLVALCSSSTVTVLAANQTLVSKTKLSPCQDSVCSGVLEFEEWVWKADLDLSGYSCCSWTLTYENDFRNGGQTYFVSAFLDKCQGSFDAKFKSKPRMLLGYYEDQMLDYSVQTSSSVDSLSYELSTGLTGINSSMTYSGNLSPIRPLKFFGFPNQNLQAPAGFHMQQNGNLVFRPIQLNEIGTIVMHAVLWKEINGTMTKVGSVCSDIEVTVISVSGNAEPDIEGRKSMPIRDTLYYCAGEPTSFSFLSRDADNDSTYFDFLFVDSAMSVSKSYAKGAQQELLLLLQSPESDTANSQGRSLRFRLIDNHCPLQGEVDYEWVFMPLKKPVASFVSFKSCQQVSVAVQVFDVGFSSAKAWWRLYDDAMQPVDSSFQSNFSTNLGPGNWHLETGFGKYGVCGVDTSFTYEVLPHYQFEWAGYDSACRQDTLSWELVNKGTNTFSYSWKNISQPLNPGIVANQNRAQIFPDSSALIELAVEDSTGCIVRYTKRAEIFQKPNYSILDTMIRCSGDSVWIGPSQATNITKLRWNDGDSAVPKLVTALGWYSFEAENSGFCMLRDSSYVGPVSGLNITQKPSDINACKLDSISVPYSGGIGAVITRFNGSVQNEYKALIDELVLVEVADTYGCLDSFSFNVWVSKKPALNFFPRSDFEVCEGDSAYLQILDIPKNAIIAWSDSSGNMSDRYLREGLYSVTLVDSVGCAFEFQVRVTELVPPNAAFTAIVNDSAEFFPQVTTGNHSWTFGDGFSSSQTSPKHRYSQEGTYTVIHEISNDQNCTSSDSIDLVILGVWGKDQARIACFPNPFNQEFLIQNAAGAEVKLFDLVGREIPVQVEELGNDSRVLVLGNLAPGHYVLQLRDDNGSRTRLVEKAP